MKTEIIKDRVTSQTLKGSNLSLEDEFVKESIDHYTSLLSDINNISPIGSFTIYHDTNGGQCHDYTHTNLTIICFENTLTSAMKEQIIDIINYLDDDVEPKFLSWPSLLILSFDF